MNYQHYNDYELISMVRENDESSYDILFSKYAPIIKSISFSYFKNYSSYGYDYEDFLQEGYFSFQKALNTYNDRKDALFYTFAVLCINRGLTSFCKRISNEHRNICNTKLCSIDDVVLSDESANLEREYLSYELERYIWSIVYNYDINYIVIFEMRLNRFSYDQISKFLEISVQKAQSMNHRLHKKLLQKIEEYT